MKTVRLHPDFLDFIKAFNETGVKYMLVGGYAVIFHGYARNTGDMDIWVEKTQENYQRIMQAFQIFGMPVFDMILQNFLDTEKLDVFSFGSPPVSIDVITSLKGLNFEDTYPFAEEKNTDGTPVKIISLDKLLEAKKASGRPKDLQDIQHLEKRKK